MHSSSHHPSQQQPHHSGLDVLQSFLSHPSTQEFLDFSPLFAVLNPFCSFISDLLGFWQLHLESDVVPASEDFPHGRWAAGI